MVLIVEDDPNTRCLFVDILRQAHIPCVATGDPEQALRWASAQRFDAILLDLALPRPADGLWLASRLRALPDAPPAILVTGHYLDPQTARSFRAILHKPTDAAEIVATVRRVAEAQLGFGF